MFTTLTARRSGLLILAAVAVGLATAACGPAIAGNTTPTAGASSPADGGTGTIGVPPQPTVTSPGGNPGGNPGPTDIAPIYPQTAEAYSKAVVNAWTQDQASTLATLTADGVKDEIVDLLASVNDQWTYLRCDGTAGSSYCSFTNADGDVFIVRISHSLLGKAHAAIEASLDETEYPMDGVAYVKEFVSAWQFGNTARMLKLSSASVVAKVKSPPASPTYPAPDCCGGGLLQVKVKWSGITNRFDVGTMKLGGPHAILDYVPGQLTITM